MTRAIIAGGGIVGLTAGRALLRAGMEVLVAEKADAIRAAGATLGLWGNAVNVFDDLDVDVRSVGREAEMYFHGTSGQLLNTPEFGEEDHRYLLAHRAGLNNLLAESVGYDNIRLEAAVAGFEEGQDSVAVRFSDGCTEEADVLIGADGLYSKVRAQLFPGTDAHEHAGHRAWRAIVKAEHIDVPDDRLIVGGKHRTRGGYVRAPDGTVFWLLSQFGASAPAASAKEECLTRSAWLTDGTWDCKLTELIDATPEQDILRNQIMVVPPLSRWVSLRVALQELSDRAEIGDIVARLGYTQDDKDFDGLAALFADRIGFDMSGAGGDPATDITRDELAGLARMVLSGFTATQHRACNVLTTVDGDIAHCRAMVDAWHTVPTDPGIADFYTARNNWLLRLERVDGRWLITRWTIMKAAPSDGYQGVYHVAQARAAQDQAQI